MMTMVMMMILDRNQFTKKNRKKRLEMFMFYGLFSFM